MSLATTGSRNPKNYHPEAMGEFLRTPEAIDMMNRARIINGGVYVMGKYVGMLPESIAKATAVLTQPALYAKAVAGNIINSAQETFNYAKQAPVATDSQFDQNGSRHDTTTQTLRSQSTQVTNDNNTPPETDPVILAQKRVLDALASNTTEHSSDLARSA